MANMYKTKKGQNVDLDDYEDNFHVAHPDDELPPMKPMTKAKKFNLIQG